MFVFLFFMRLVENVKFLFLEPDAAETIIAPDAVMAGLAVNAILRVNRVIAIIGIYAIHAFVTKLAFVAERAVIAIPAIKNARIVHAVLGHIARKSHVAIFAFFRVLAIRAVFVLYALKSDMRFFPAEQMELFKEIH